MYIYGLSEYLPERVVGNEYFGDRAGRAAKWYERLTGMRERRRAGPGENANTMAISAVARLAQEHPGSLEDVDLIVGGSYTPWDTIATIAHVVQRRFELRKARALFISSACSSFLNAIELAVAYFESGRAATALLVMSEHNSLYGSDDDPMSGHLWGDGAAAILISRSPRPGTFLRILEVTTAGLGCVGLGPEAIYCAPRGGGLVMPEGKDVFQHACQSMADATREILRRNGLAPEDMRLLIAHQANGRILGQIAQDLHLRADRVASTVETLGNTGCASIPITLHRHRHTLTKGDWLTLAAFGGGYSVGAALVRAE
jgi:3-oxoacyl-[acyl-carrier-protein] synthase III